MRKKQTIVALLPMKAHSERVSGKNFREFNGKPLFFWVMETLLALPEIARVVINTDARKILSEHGVTDGSRILIRDRKPALCGDFTSMNRIIEDDVTHVAADVYLMTHTTNPLLRKSTVRGALERFDKLRAAGETDSLFTVNRYQTRFYRADGTAVNHDPDNLVRTQDLEPWYEENSNLYVFTRESFQRTRARIGARPAMMEMERWESSDIDDQQGWELAEIVARSKIRP